MMFLQHLTEDTTGMVLHSQLTKTYQYLLVWDVDMDTAQREESQGISASYTMFNNS